MKHIFITVLLIVGISVPACRAGCGNLGTGPIPSGHRGFLLASRRLHRSGRQGTRHRENHILVQAYSFTSTPIAKALLEAHKRGVKVEVILDKSQKSEKYSEADFLVNVGIPTKIDTKHAIAHNKIIVIDGAVVITGSFNFTKHAEENNAENLLVIRSPDLAAKYTANWKVHAEHSDPYAGREQGYSQTHRDAGQAAPPPAVAGDGFVASKNSAVFHKPDCKSAAKISPKNLVHYATRDEAIQAGKHPCAECRP